MKPVFDNNGLATHAGDLRCFYYDGATKEYTGWSDEFINIGVSMPGNSTDVNPGDEVAGRVAVFSNDSWEWQEDHRGDTVYSTEDGTASVIDYIGEIKDGFTTTEPDTQYDTWDGSQWVIDEEAQRADIIAAAESEKSRLRAVADSEIEWRQDAVDAEIATEEETAALVEWKKYRVLLMRVDTAAPDWPTPPTE
ncbi:tail fiber assembly protein [Escherichia coli]|nr:tail fiber assembly protein [Escherichia coli]